MDGRNMRKREAKRDKERERVSAKRMIQIQNIRYLPVIVIIVEHYI